MPCFEMWRRVALVITDASEESIASVIRVKRISELGKAIAVTSNEAKKSQRVSVVSYC
jgi:CO dehydrogenase nickel-insertion accessory protein CooC1